MAFTDAKDNDMSKILGENGCPQLNTSKDSLVDLLSRPDPRVLFEASKQLFDYQ